MSHQHIRAWQDLLQRLSALKDNVHDSTGWLRHRELSKAALTSVEGLPAVMPHAVLKKLVQQAQIPRRLVAAAVSLPADLPADKARFLRLIHAHTLRHLLQRVTAAGLLGSSSSSSSSSLAAAFKQQIFQDGLFRFIAACMTERAEQLQAAAIMRGASLLHHADFSTDVHIGQQGFSTDNAIHTSYLLELYYRLHTQLKAAQQVQESLNSFAALATPAACHLTVASLQFIAAIPHPGQQQHQQQHQLQQGCAAAAEPDENLGALLEWCCLCMPTVLATIESTQDPPDSEVPTVQSFYLIPWMAASWLVQSYASLMQQHTLLPPAQACSSSSSSSSSGSNIGKSSRAESRAAAAGTSSSGSSSSNPVVQGRSRTPRDEALRTWREAARQLDRLPAAHSELAALLGTDLQTIVWAAITLVQINPTPKELSFFLVRCITTLVTQAPSPLRSSVPGLYELLYWAAHESGGVYDSGEDLVVLGSKTALDVWGYTSSTEQQQDDAAAAAGAATQESGDLPILHPCVVEEGLPLVLLLLARLQQQSAIPSVADGSAAAESTGVHGDQQCSTAAHARKPLPPTVGTQVPGAELLWYMCACSPGGTRAAASASPAAGRAAAEAPAAAMGDASAACGHVDPAQQHCTSVIKVLEAFVRANAQEGTSTSETLERLLGTFFPDEPSMIERSLWCLPALAAASGNEAQHELLGLLRSLLKLSAAALHQDRDTALLCIEVCGAAAGHLMSCLSTDAAAGSTSSSSSSSGNSKLPWLHLLGHWFMQWSAEQQRIGVEADGPEEQEAAATNDHSLGAGVSAAAATGVCGSTQPGLSSALQQQQKEDEDEQQQQQQTAVATSVEGPLPADSTLQSTDAGTNDGLLVVRQALCQESAAIAAMGLDHDLILQTLDALEAAAAAYKLRRKHDTAASNAELVSVGRAMEGCRGCPHYPGSAQLLQQPQLQQRQRPC